jgi:hypothetical protein
VFRWNPGADDASSRTIDRSNRSAISFPGDMKSPDANDMLLMVSGGNVQTLDAKKQTTPVVLPPPSSTITESKDEEQGGPQALFQALYGDLGTSFRFARYCKSGRFIAAVMEREGGEVLILQNMQPKDGQLPRPIPVVAGDRVDFDVNPIDGSIVYVAQNFKLPDPDHVPAMFRKGNRIVLPFKHVVGFIDPEKGAQAPIGATGDNNVSFGSPAVSPDGSSVLLVVGPYDPSTSSQVAKEILTVPIKPGGIQARSVLVEGDAHEPAWSPDGSSVVFAMRSNGHRDIYKIAKDGSNQVNLTAGKGDFSLPLFSPQQPKG